MKKQCEKQNHKICRTFLVRVNESILKIYESYVYWLVRSFW